MEKDGGREAEREKHTQTNARVLEETGCQEVAKEGSVLPLENQ